MSWKLKLIRNLKYNLFEKYLRIFLRQLGYMQEWLVLLKVFQYIKITLNKSDIRINIMPNKF